MKFLKLILVLILCQSVAAEDIVFSVRSQQLKVAPIDGRGHNVYLNDKLVHFIPVTSRSDIRSAAMAISDYGLDDKQKTKLFNYLNSDFDNSLKGASEEDLLKASLEIGRTAQKIISEEIKEDCLKNSKDISQKKKAAPAKKTQEIYCECELPNNMKLSDEDIFKLTPSNEDKYWNDFSLLGEIEEISFGLDTTNDNHLHGLWRNIASPELDGNDRGRTFGINLDFKAVGSKGELQISYESEIFTQMRETSPGSGYFYIDGDNKFLQDQLERNRLDLKLLRNIEGTNTYVISGFELQQLTDDGSVAGPLQDAWHGLYENNNVIQYTNQDFMKNDVDLTLYGGVGKEWLSDLGNWKCRTRAEFTAGVNVLDMEDSFVKARGEIDLNSNKLFDGDEDNPWFIVSMWAEASVENQGTNQHGTGVNVKFPIEVSSWRIEPSIGMSLEYEKEDAYFTQSQSRKIEPQSHIGLTITKKF
ncbi:hypothetical protein [Halobacteriovorax sp. HLS]|uniref:hypothetical protein n=1 Tax=Halobacteriovorax sp. HLS TaxID=2234000 RepID=UPI000FDBFCC2|nr:hypothetical protein [Halobacteriovorax sp. HLS]